jgi:hypothetical protein
VNFPSLANLYVVTDTFVASLALDGHVLLWRVSKPQRNADASGDTAWVTPSATLECKVQDD